MATQDSSILRKHGYAVLLFVTALTLGIGTVVYHFVERFNWVDAYYFSVITLATVGYGDFVPHTDIGKIFTTFYVFIGVGIMTTFITTTVRRRAAKIEHRHEDRHESGTVEKR